MRLMALRRSLSLLSRFGRDRSGTVALIMAFLAIPLIGCIGLAVDTGRAHLVRARLAQALDAAALAGGRVFFEPTRDADIRKFFHANFPDGYLGATVTEPTIAADAVAGTLSVAVSGTLPTSFMRVLGFRELPVGARTVVQRADRGMELVLVMDNTGSMYQGGSSTSRINRMKSAALDLVAILYGGRQSVQNLWVGLVPYTASVNIGASRTEWLQTGSLAALNYQGVSSWKGCVEARDASGNDVTDATPTEAPFRPFFFAPHAIDNNWPPPEERVSVNTTSNNGRGPNLGCGPAITPLTESRATVEAAITGMAAWHRGGTLTSEGLGWGWRVLSPRWRSLWGGATPANLPLEYNTPLMSKVVVILTDGKNELYSLPARNGQDSDYTAYGRVSAGRLGTITDYRTAARRDVNRRTLLLCDALKAQGVLIYTITFEVDNDTAGTEGKTTFRNCATSPSYFFDNPVGTDLSATFRTIGNQLSNLRLAE